MKAINYISFFILFIIISCDDNRIFEKNIDIQNNEWDVNNNLDFEVKIKNTNLKKVFVNFRHTSEFNYRNVILELIVTNPKAIKDTLNINIPLSEPNGKWYGDCTGNICNLQHSIKYNFSDTGLYKFSFLQNMRENPLSNTLSVGLRIENSK